MMRGLELPSRSQSREVGTQPELAGVSRQVEVTWPDLLPPLVLEWTETLLVAVDHSSVPWVIGPAGRGSCARSTGPYRYSSTTTSQVDPDGVVRTHRPSAIDRRKAGHGDGCLDDHRRQLVRPNFQAHCGDHPRRSPQAGNDLGPHGVRHASCARTTH